MKIPAARFCTLIAVSLAGLALAMPADAQSHGGGRGGAGVHASSGHGGGGGRGYGGGRGGGGGWQRGGHGWWGVGLGLGLGWGAAYYGEPYAWYPGYYEQVEPQVMVEQAPQYQVQPYAPQQGTVAPPNGSTASNWYYCDSSKAYYPYVNRCPEGWRTVPVVPTGP
jgi:hypothetical protein